MNDDKESAELSELLGRKDFNQLTERERLFVLTHITEKEYKNLQQISVRLTASLNSDRPHLKPDKNVKSALLQSFKQKNKKTSASSIIENLLNYRVPAYQPALALICLIFIHFYSGKNNLNKISDKPDVKTAFINKEEEQQSEIIKEIKDTIMLPEISEIVTNSHTDEVHSTNDESEYVPLINTGAIAVFTLADEQINGPSLKQDTMLSSYFVSPN